jgi:hypothetical protein
MIKQYIRELLIHLECKTSSQESTDFIVYVLIIFKSLGMLSVINTVVIAEQLQLGVFLTYYGKLQFTALAFLE